MDYPISVPSVGLIGGKFVDEDPLAGTPGSLIPAQWGNAVTEEILRVISAAGLTPREEDNTQLLAAIKAVVVSAGVTPGRLIAVRVSAAAGPSTYVPTGGMKEVIVKLVGGGGGGGFAAASGSGQVSIPGGGGSGSYAEGRFSAAVIGSSVSITVGAGGAGGTSGPGGSGGATSFGSLMTAPGGFGAVGHGPAAPPLMKAGALANGIATGGNILNTTGSPGGAGFSITDILSGAGGGSPMTGGSGGGNGALINQVGSDGISPGSGGGGGCTSNGASRSGGRGKDGMIAVWELS